MRRFFLFLFAFVFVVANANIGHAIEYPLAVQGVLTSGFSLNRMHPILRRVRPHKGVDLAAPIGTVVRSAISGKVVFAGEYGGYGYLIIVESESSRTLYGHLERFLVRKKQMVNEGDPIGTVGMTGMTTGPHLHFEFHERTANGWNPIDPLPLLKQKSGERPPDNPKPEGFQSEAEENKFQIEKLLPAWVDRFDR